MGTRLITAGGILLALVVAAGTVLYIQGIAPPFPWSAHAFNLMLLVCILYAVAFGRKGQGAGSKGDVGMVGDEGDGKQR